MSEPRCALVARRSWQRGWLIPAPGSAHAAGALLRRGVRALFFNGQYDMICNHAGIEASRSRKQAACLVALCFVDSRRPQHFGAQRLSRSPRLTMHGGRGNHTYSLSGDNSWGKRLGDFLGTELHY